MQNPPIGDQGNQGSCVGWATGYAALGTLTFAKYNCWDLASRSPSYVYNQIKVGNCLDGSYLIDGVNLIKNDGSCSLSLMPYNENDCSTQPNATQIFEASCHDAVNSYAIYPNTDVNEIIDAIDLGYPVPCAFDVYQSFITTWEDDGIWDIYPNSGTYRGSHAVCIIGYDNVVDRFLVQNSWGTTDGDEGYFWVPFSMVENGMIEELYIVYGMDAQYPETVTGSNLICSSGSTITVNNFPNGCGIDWDKSSNLNISQASGNSALFSANGNGSGWIRATVTHSGCSDFDLPDYNVWVGVPSVEVDGPSEGSVGNSYTYYEYPAAYSNPTSFEWTLSPPYDNNSIYNYGYWANAAFYASQEGYFQIGCTPQNSCGTGSMATTYIYIYNYRSDYLLSPNPASDEVMISINHKTSSSSTTPEETTYEISIYNMYGILQSREKFRGNDFKMSIRNLNNGNYIVKIDNGRSITSKQLIIKH